MDATCSWQCKASTTRNPDNVTTTNQHEATTSKSEDEKYCVGDGTDMYMQGFAVGVKQF